MSSMIYKKKTPLLFFLIPAFTFLIVYLYYPFIQNIINTFMHIGGLGRTAEGLNTPWYANYKELFTDPDLRTALKNTLILTVFTVVFQVGIALILALLVDSIRVGSQVFRTVYFFPIVISATANLENSAVATGLGKVSFQSNPKERQCQRMLKLLHNCTHLTC